MLQARKRPGRGEDEDVGPLFDRERAVNLRKPKVVADAQAKAKPAEGETLQLTAGREAFVLSNRRAGEKMSLAIAPHDLALRVDEDLRIVDRVPVAFRDTADDRNRKVLRDLAGVRGRLLQSTASRSSWMTGIA